MKEPYNSKKFEDDWDDEEFEKWITQKVVEEAAEMIADLEEIPEEDIPSISEDGFQNLLQRAREEGLIDDD